MLPIKTRELFGWNVNQSFDAYRRSMLLKQEFSQRAAWCKPLLEVKNNFMKLVLSTDDVNLNMRNLSEFKYNMIRSRDTLIFGNFDDTKEMFVEESTGSAGFSCIKFLDIATCKMYAYLSMGTRLLLTLPFDDNNNKYVFDGKDVHPLGFSLIDSDITKTISEFETGIDIYTHYGKIRDIKPHDNEYVLVTDDDYVLVTGPVSLGIYTLTPARQNHEFSTELYGIQDDLQIKSIAITVDTMREIMKLIKRV